MWLKKKNENTPFLCYSEFMAEMLFVHNDDYANSSRNSKSLLIFQSACNLYITQQSHVHLEIAKGNLSFTVPDDIFNITHA